MSAAIHLLFRQVSPLRQCLLLPVVVAVDLAPGVVAVEQVEFFMVQAIH
jgi:hypothetical protein